MTTTAVRITSRLRPGDERTLSEDVLDGLTRPAKELPSKHFYDAYGSELFERITELPEYYPTRTERWILEAIAGQVAEHTGAGELVELGAGYATKTRVLLDAMAANGTLRSYVPLDVSEATVLASAAQLVEEYPGCRSTASSATSSATSTRCPSPRARGSSPCWAGRWGTSCPARGGGSCARCAASSARTTGCCSAPTS